MNLIKLISDFEESFSTATAIKYTNEHAEIPVFAITLYLAVSTLPIMLSQPSLLFLSSFSSNHLSTTYYYYLLLLTISQIVFYGPEWFKQNNHNGFSSLRYPWAFWNLLLSVFSVIGAYKTVPALVDALMKNGFQYTTCADPSLWFLSEKNPVGMWVTLFIYSKIPELLDTVFLVLQRKPVIFLHWFHHVTVLLYCWHAFANWTASGLWFVAMNFTVHSVMYLYYFLSIAGFKSLASPLAPTITSIQLLQMIVGCIVTWNTAQTKMSGGECAVDTANYKLGLSMYASYFFLFAMLFYNLYIKTGGKHAKNGGGRKGGGSGAGSAAAANGGKAPANNGKPAMSREASSDSLCGVELRGGDAAGFFHTNSAADTDRAKKKE